MNRKFLLIAILGFMLAACGSAATPAAQPTAAPIIEPTTVPTLAPTLEPTAAPIILTDGLGREVTLAAPAARIVSLAPSNTEILFALNAGGLLIGRDDFSDYPPEAANVPSIGSLYPNVNAEAIVALQPDLVLAAGITNPADVQKLADLGVTVYATSFATDLDDIFNDILAVGALIGKSGEADAMVAGLKARVDSVTAKVSAAAVKPVVFYEVDATEPEKPWTAGTGTFIDTMIATAGGVNAGAVAADYFQISFEQLVTQDPDVIVLGSFTYGGQTPELVAQRPGWDSLKAVKNNTVYTFDDNLVSRPGPRVVDGLETLAKLFHPDLFK
ncbi:MAG: cobalamin-binding protein [Chloroflexi bacterium]|nr:cobalamin-binding protein [Chloroflexota bacterium]